MGINMNRSIITEEDIETHLRRLNVIKQKRRKQLKELLSTLENELDPIVNENIAVYKEYDELKRKYGQEYKDKLMIGKLSSCTQRMNRINRSIRAIREELKQ